MKYLIFGKGFLGNRFKDILGEEACLTDRRIESKNDLPQVIADIKKTGAEFVINTIGKTGEVNIDWCEKNKKITWASNVDVPCIIAKACEKTDTQMVQLGSGCIYEGDNNGQGFSETDDANFFDSFYSVSKIASETALQFSDALIIRIRMPLDNRPSGRNLLDKLLKYEKIVNIPNSISVVPDVLTTTKELMRRKETGVFNLVNSGTITHQELIEMYQMISGKQVKKQYLTADEFKKSNLTKTGRSNCVLSTEKLEKMGIAMPPIKTSAYQCIKEYCITKGECRGQ